MFTSIYTWETGLGYSQGKKDDEQIWKRKYKLEPLHSRGFQYKMHLHGQRGHHKQQKRIGEKSEFNILL